MHRESGWVVATGQAEVKVRSGEVRVRSGRKVKVRSGYSPGEVGARSCEVRVRVRCKVG